MEDEENVSNEASEEYDIVEDLITLGRWSLKNRITFILISRYIVGYARVKAWVEYVGGFVWRTQLALFRACFPSSLLSIHLLPFNQIAFH